MSPVIMGGVEENVYLGDSSTMSELKLETPSSKNNKIASTGGIAKKVMDSLKNSLKTSLFMENLRGVNWSRAYDWYCELDGVPAPFNRGGNLGLPVKHISFTITEGSEYTFSAGSVETLKVPRQVGTLGVIALDLFDDEQQTLAKFFERWHNQIYNPYKGVLPVTEACKQITIYRQKSTRKNLKRVYYNMDQSVSSLVTKVASSITKEKSPRVTEGFDFLVFPTGPLQFGWGTDVNDLTTLNAQLQVVHFVNQDFGNPTINANLDTKGTDMLRTLAGLLPTNNAFLSSIVSLI